MVGKLNTAITRYFPERRVFLRGDSDTRFLRLSPSTQAVGFFGVCLLVSWAIIATAILLMDSIGAGNFREQAKRDQQTYQERLDLLAAERDARTREAIAAQKRYSLALAEISEMQSDLLFLELQREELRRGLTSVRGKLQDAVENYDDANASLHDLTERVASPNGKNARPDMERDNETLQALSSLLESTANERDQLRQEAETAYARAAQIELDLRLMSENNEQIFQTLEDALTVSMKPLDKMFSAAGLNTDRLLEKVRRGYSGYGGALTEVDVSVRQDVSSSNRKRSGKILSSIDELNLYRIAAEKLPFAHPLRGSYRFTSGFGRRWGRMHKGADFAARRGTPILATADGVVIFTGWQSAYGRLIKIRHEFGIETRYAHLSKIRVKKGQKVSRGERIGDMGNSGRSTGTHLHYEIRDGGRAVNPMIYIRAGKNVF